MPNMTQSVQISVVTDSEIAASFLILSCTVVSYVPRSSSDEDAGCGGFFVFFALNGKERQRLKILQNKITSKVYHITSNEYQQEDVRRGDCDLCSFELSRSKFSRHRILPTAHRHLHRPTSRPPSTKSCSSNTTIL